MTTTPPPATPPAAAPAGPATNTLAIISLIAAFVVAPVGIVLGFIAKNQIKTSGEGGSGLATAGIILGFVFTIGYILLIVGSFLIPLLFLGVAGQYGY